MRIAEIFESIHGECNGHHQGRLVTFVRVAGCNLKCNWGNGVICDTPDTQDASNGKEVTEDYVINRVRSIGNKYVCITGGEPLMNKSIEILSTNESSNVDTQKYINDNSWEKIAKQWHENLMVRSRCESRTLR